MRRRDVSKALLLGSSGAAFATGDFPAQVGPRYSYPQTEAETATAVVPVNASFPPGTVDRYAANVQPGVTDMSTAFACAAKQSTRPGGAPAVVNTNARYRLARSVAIPTDAQLHIAAGTVAIDAGQTLTIDGAFAALRIPCFSATAAVIFGKGAVSAIYPEWFGAVGSTQVHGGPPDSTAAFAAAITAATEHGRGAVAIHPISIGPGSYTVGNVMLPPATVIRGTGRHTTNIFCAKGTRKAWWTDSGSASKIILEDFALYGNNEPGLTAGLQLGSGAVPHGTEGYINRLWIRDIPNGTGFDVLGNVGLYDTITVYNSATNIKIIGSANIARGLISQGGGGKVGLGRDACSVWLGGTNVSGLEIEGMATGTVALRLDHNVSIQGLWISFAPDTAFDHVWELGPGATTWAIENLTYYFKGDVSVRRGNARRADGTYFAGNASGSNGNHDGEGNFSSDSAGQKLQSFTLHITNQGGRLQHRICEAGGSPTNFAATIKGATAHPTVTPIGTDSSTSFDGGGKIGSAAPGLFWLDTTDQRISDTVGLAVISHNTTGIPLNVISLMQSGTIGGVTRNRLSFVFTHAVTGVPFPLDAATIPPGQLVQISWQGYLSA